MRFLQTIRGARSLAHNFRKRAQFPRRQNLWMRGQYLLDKSGSRSRHSHDEDRPLVSMCGPRQRPSTPLAVISNFGVDPNWCCAAGSKDRRPSSLPSRACLNAASYRLIRSSKVAAE